LSPFTTGKSSPNQTVSFCSFELAGTAFGGAGLPTSRSPGKGFSWRLARTPAAPAEFEFKTFCVFCAFLRLIFSL
jgi:hypothetical protein